MKKYIKIAGNILMIASFAFVVKKLLDMDISLSQLSSGRVAAAAGICFAVQTLIIICSCFPWLMFTRSLSGVRIPFSAAVPVYTRSNLYKYIPGNVFQYVGRNQLAADMSISHVDVACATLLDIFFCVFWTGAVSAVLLGGRIADLLGKYGGRLLIVIIAGIALLGLLAAVLLIKFGDRVRGYLSRYSKAFEKGRRGQFMSGVGYYFLHNCVSAGMYLACIALVVPEASADELAVLTGAFMFAWIIGFVTPGAPGGIGIREGVMIFVSGEKYQERIILFVLAIRIASILADIAAFAIFCVFGKKKNAKRRNC